MGLIWVPLPVNLQDRTWAEDGGMWSMHIYTTILRIVADLGEDGICDAGLITTERICRRGGVEPRYSRRVAVEVASLTRCGAVEIRDGSCHVTGWVNPRFDPTGSKRVKGYRDRKKSETRNSNVTCNVTGNVSPADRIEQSRIEQSRIEENRREPPIPPLGGAGDVDPPVRQEATQAPTPEPSDVQAPIQGDLIPPEHTPEPEPDPEAQLWTARRADWNAMCSRCPGPRQIVSWTDKRKASAGARLGSGPEAEQRWSALLAKIEASPFLSRKCLESIDRSWRPDIDFALTPSGWARIMEGKYDAKPNGRQDDDEFLGGGNYR